MCGSCAGKIESYLACEVAAASTGCQLDCGTNGGSPTTPTPGGGPTAPAPTPTSPGAPTLPPNPFGGTSSSGAADLGRGRSFLLPFATVLLAMAGSIVATATTIGDVV
jgi:hypothetical protein